MLKKIQNKRFKNALFLLSRPPTHRSFTFNLRFLYELKHKVRQGRIQTLNSTAKLCSKSSDQLVFLIYSHKLPWKSFKVACVVYVKLFFYGLILL